MNVASNRCHLLLICNFFFIAPHFSCHFLVSTCVWNKLISWMHVFSCRTQSVGFFTVICTTFLSFCAPFSVSYIIFPLLHIFRLFTVFVLAQSLFLSSTSMSSTSSAFRLLYIFLNCHIAFAGICLHFVGFTRAHTKHQKQCTQYVPDSFPCMFYNAHLHCPCQINISNGDGYKFQLCQYSYKLITINKCYGQLDTNAVKIHYNK